MPQALVREGRGLVDLYRITSSQRAEHAAVLLLRRAHFTPLGNDVPRVAGDGRARRLREGLARRAREDGEHRCWAGAAARRLWRCGELFLWSGCARLWGRERLFARCALSRGVVKRPTEVETPCPLLPRATNAAGRALLARPRSAPASQRTRPFPGVSQSNQTKKRMRRRVRFRAGCLELSLLDLADSSQAQSCTQSCSLCTYSCL